MVVCLVVDIDDTLFVHKTIGGAIIMDYDKIRPDYQLKSQLQRITYPKYILTNATYDHANIILNKLDVDDEFKNIYSRDNMPAMKPHPLCYDSVEKDIESSLLGQTRNQFIFFDDLLNNLDIAHLRGWRTIWISPKYKESHRYPFVDKAFPTLKDALDKLNMYTHI